jgi:hypothetical protein
LLIQAMYPAGPELHVFGGFWAPFPKRSQRAFGVSPVRQIVLDTGNQQA